MAKIIVLLKLTLAKALRLCVVEHQQSGTMWL